VTVGPSDEPAPSAARGTAGPLYRWSAGAVAEALATRSPGRFTFAGVGTDTRHLTPGTLFVALKGEHFDAHDFLADAKARGAAAAVVRRGTARLDGLPFFEVPDTLAALGLLAHARRRALPAGAPVVAVTGSTGKTSAKEMIRAALAARWRAHATTGNLNNLIGVPLTILGTPGDAQAVVVEAGASVPGEIAKLRAIIEPTIAVITNVGFAHIEGFGSLAGVMREKLALLDGVPVAVVGTEPPELAVESRRRTRTIVAGRAASADIRPVRAELDDAGRPVLEWHGRTVTLPVTGLHQVDNAMIALAVAEQAGVEPAAAMGRLTGVALPPGRGSLVSKGGLTIIDDTYNANPTSMRAALQLAAAYGARHRRPVAVMLGSMLELGADSARLHAAVADEVMALDPAPALVAAVGAFVPAFARHASALGARLVTAPDAETLGPALAGRLVGNEVVLLKASRGVALERVLPHLH
jgi:UDP-N-acetylmuramoyl-tripeptide--D-alanyl-D-alanine ligase